MCMFWKTVTSIDAHLPCILFWWTFTTRETYEYALISNITELVKHLVTLKLPSKDKWQICRIPPVTLRAALNVFTASRYLCPCTWRTLLFSLMKNPWLSRGRFGRTDQEVKGISWLEGNTRDVAAQSSHWLAASYPTESRKYSWCRQNEDWPQHSRPICRAFQIWNHLVKWGHLRTADRTTPQRIPTVQ